MSVIVTCEECGKQYRVGPERFGTVIPCKICSTMMRVPGRLTGKAPVKAAPLVLAVVAGIVVMGLAAAVAVFFRNHRGADRESDVAISPLQDPSEPAQDRSGFGSRKQPGPDIPQVPPAFHRSKPNGVSPATPAGTNLTGQQAAAIPGRAAPRVAKKQKPPVTILEPDYKLLSTPSIGDVAPTILKPTMNDTTSRATHRAPDDSWYGKPGYAVKLSPEFELDSVDDPHGDLEMAWQLIGSESETRLSMSFRYDRRIQAGSTPEMHVSGAAVSQNGEMFYVTGGVIDQLTLGKVPFRRLTWPLQEDNQHHWVMVAHFDGMRLKFQGSTTAGPDSNENGKMLKIVRTFSLRTADVITPEPLGVADSELQSAAKGSAIGSFGSSVETDRSAAQKPWAAPDGSVAETVPRSPMSDSKSIESLDPNRGVAFRNKSSVVFARPPSPLVLVENDVYDLTTKENKGGRNRFQYVGAMAERLYAGWTFMSVA